MVKMMSDLKKSNDYIKVKLDMLQQILKEIDNSKDLKEFKFKIKEKIKLLRLRTMKL